MIDIHSRTTIRSSRMGMAEACGHKYRLRSVLQVFSRVCSPCSITNPKGTPMTCRMGLQFSGLERNHLISRGYVEEKVRPHLHSCIRAEVQSGATEGRHHRISWSRSTRRSSRPLYDSAPASLKALSANRPHQNCYEPRKVVRHVVKSFPKWLC